MMKNLLRRRFLPAILCVVLALGLSACGGKDTLPVETGNGRCDGHPFRQQGRKRFRVGVFSGSGKKQRRRNWRRSP